MTPRMIRAAAFMAGVVVLASCENGPSEFDDIEPIGFGRAYDVWRPSAPGECTAALHNAYSVIGPDGKLYPTWHPPTDPATGCSFGHEHGRDPRGSALYNDIRPLAFGYANDQQEIHDPGMIRHEDHVGHKIEWENGVTMTFEGAEGALLEVVCDALMKLHQGSHSKDAFTNNLHELIYAVQCSDGTKMHLTFLAAFGRAGEMVASCDRDRVIQAGTPTPANSPHGFGQRVIPDRECVEQLMMVQPGQWSNYHLALRESWEIFTMIRRPNGRLIAAVDPYFQIFFPSRFYDASQPDNVGRPIDVCYETLPDGSRPRGGLCAASTNNGSIEGLSYDDPRSRFNGVQRMVFINSPRIANADGPDVWYTDPLGRNARTEPFPGSIRQYIAAIDNTERVGRGPIVGQNRDYGGVGTRAPN